MRQDPVAPSLAEYVLVSQAERRMEVSRREGQQWILGEARAGQVARLASIDVEISVDDVMRARSRESRGRRFFLIVLQFPRSQWRPRRTRLSGIVAPVTATGLA
jgi:hypothetical protein